jgi:CAAX protease family protein
MARYCSRHGMGALAGGHALLLYFALAFAGFWTCLALAPVAPMLPFLGAACEELGWRGYALPRLLAQHKPVTASLILGTVHAAWHAPLFLAGQPLASMPVAPYWAWVASQSILMTWILRRARGSVLMAALLHGTSNLTLLVYQGIDRAWTPWLRASIAIAMALTVDVLDARLRRREPSMAAA